MELNMIPYNTGMDRLVLPEYGRTVQEMVKYCQTIEDRDARTACAYAIVDTLARLFPSQIGENGDRKKLWDELNIISGFTLDVDFPVEVATRESVHPVPEKIPYSTPLLHHRYYGNHVMSMIRTVSEMEEGPERDIFISRLAHHMKKLMMIHNRKGVPDAKILSDLAELSEGRIMLDPDTYLLHDFMEETPAPVKGKSKKKKRRMY